MIDVQEKVIQAKIVVTSWNFLTDDGISKTIITYKIGGTLLGSIEHTTKQPKSWIVKVGRKNGYKHPKTHAKETK